jgi:hypothetical protein
MTRIAGIRTIAAASVVVVLLSLGADETTQTIQVDNLTLKVPASWKKVPPANAMRKAQFRIDPAKGEETPGEFSISSFGGGGGGVQANIDRWRGQFKDKNGGAVAAETTTIKGDNYEITRVEVAGTYTDPFSKAGPQANYRLLGAIVSGDNSAFFLKVIGPDKTVSGGKEGFDAMLKSLKLGKP